MDEVLKTIAPTPAGAIFFLAAAVVAFLAKLGVVVFVVVQAVRKRGSVRIFCLMILTSFALMVAAVAISFGAPTMKPAVVIAAPYLLGGSVLFVEGAYVVSVVGGIARARWSGPLFALYIAVNIASDLISYTPNLSVWQNILDALRLVVEGAALSFLFFVVIGQRQSERAAIPEVF